MNSPFDRGKPSVWREGDEISSMPKEHGAYRFVIEESNSVDYIGITSNLYKRLISHQSTKKQYNPNLHRVEYQVAKTAADWTQLKNWEERKISAHMPTLNKTSGKNGRVARRYLFDNTEIKVQPDESIEDAANQKGLLDRLLGLFR